MNKSLFMNKRIIILAIFLILAVVAIAPRLDTEGVAIRSVTADSPATRSIPLALEGPQAGSAPQSWEVLKSINGNEINSVEEYYNYPVKANETLLLRTDEATYRVKTQNATEIGLRVGDVPNNNIRKGLDLAGGTRVLLQPKETISTEDQDLLIEGIRQRLNIFGLSDVVVRGVTDFTGESYVLVEIAGVNQDEVRQLLASQGKFEATVGNNSVFTGGDDIVYVCKSASCSGIDPQTGCQQISAAETVCNFRFSISLSSDAAQRMAEATEDLSVEIAGGQSYLSENITLSLDGEVVNQLRISESLQGTAQTEISISGSGSGSSQSVAAQAALDEMKQLQTVMVTGSLPVELEIIQTDAISPILGEEFLNNAILVGLLSLLAVVVVVTVRYQKWKIAVPTIIAMISEVVILLGFAAFVGWRIDLVAIAGIIIAVGTGVDDQIVITDETLNRKNSEKVTWKKRVKRAFFIIFTAYFTTVVAMIPLWYSGAGLLKGFALTTIAGVTIGVLITRPAYSVILETLLGKRKD